MPRSPRRPILLAAAILTTGLVAAGCANPYSGELLLADVADPTQAQAPVSIYAVDPGDDPTDGNVLTSAALSPLDVSTRSEDGLTWVNSLGRTWDGGTLLAYGDGEQSVVTAGDPGDDQAELARSPQLRTTVLRRGTFIETTEGCVLATGGSSVDQVGTGGCSISLDERWVASWQPSGEGLSIRDLRNDSTEQVDGLPVANAAALSADARVLAVVGVTDGFQGVVIDATDGSEVGRTDTYPFLDVAAIDEGADGFVLQARNESGTELLWVDTDAEVETIDSGGVLIPVLNGAELTYLSYSQDLAENSLRRWSPGGEPEVLLEGYVGAGPVDEEHVIATLETPDGTEFYRQNGGTGEMEKVLTLPNAAPDAAAGGQAVGVAVSQALVQGHTAYLQVDGAAGSSFVRIDLTGDDSDAPLVNQTGLRLESLDVDGTALLVQQTGDPTTPSNAVLVLRPDDEEPDTRATLARVATSLIHEGVIYLTDASDPNEIVVRSLRATGSDTGTTLLYKDKQLAGATWPQQGGATQPLVITPRLLLEQQQQAAQQQQAQAGAQQQQAAGSGAQAGGGGTGSGGTANSGGAGGGSQGGGGAGGGN